MTTIPAIDRNSPAPPSPLDTPSAPRPGKLLTVLLVMPAAVLLLTPFGLVAAAAAAQPDLLLVLADKPLVALQLTLGLALSLLFCTLPFRRFASSRHLAPRAD